MIEIKHNLKKVNFDKKVSVMEMSIEEFLSLPPVPMQRDTEGRIKKAEKMLKKLLPVHLDVAIVELMKDSEYFGKKYKKGDRFTVNANTRAFYWLNGLSDAIPEKVFASIYSVDDMEEVRKIYNTFDSPDATEKTQEKFYGILKGVYQYQPISSKVQKGEILTALIYACNCLDPVKYSFSGKKQPKEEILKFLIGEFIEEIKIFDKLIQYPKQWDAALTCAALMILKTHNQNPKAIEFLERVEQRVIDTTKAERDGVTHVSLEWTSNAKFAVRRAAFSKPGGMQETVPFVLYWAEKYFSDKKQLQVGSNWDKTHINWFKSYNKMNTAFVNLLFKDLEQLNESV